MSTYRPTKRQVIDSETAPDAVRVTVSDTLPPALSAALHDAEQVLTQRKRIYGVLRETHDSVPRLLRERLAAETQAAQAEVIGSDLQGRGRLNEIESQLKDAKRRRTGAIVALMTDPVFGQTALQAARDRVKAAKVDYVRSVARDFETRYSAAIATVQAMWTEADSLEAQGIRVAASIPAKFRVT